MEACLHPKSQQKTPGADRGVYRKEKGFFLLSFGSKVMGSPQDELCYEKIKEEIRICGLQLESCPCAGVQARKSRLFLALNREGIVQS